MTRLDLHWGTGVEVREAVWSWRHDIAAQVVNPDIDGLLSACLLHHLKGWPVVGFYDTQRLLIDSTHQLPLDLQRTVWVDVDMCWPGARSLSQHVVMDRPSDRDAVSAYRRRSTRASCVVTRDNTTTEPSTRSGPSSGRGGWRTTDNSRRLMTTC